MKSSTYYFSHDYNAANDTKILFLRHQLGMEGYGIYWYLIEQLANAGGKLPLELIPVLAMQMHCTDVKVNGVLMNFDLFTIESGEFWSHRLQDHLELRLKLSQSGKAGANNRWKNGGAIGGAIGEGNAKKRKENKIKENKTNNNNKDNFVNSIEEFKEILGDSYNEFIEYWCESDKNGKLRYELEKFFDVKRRINTWIKNKLRYGNSKTSTPTATSKERMDALAKWVHS